jgi:hypothetical protein
MQRVRRCAWRSGRLVMLMMTVVPVATAVLEREPAQATTWVVSSSGGRRHAGLCIVHQGAQVHFWTRGQGVGREQLGDDRVMVLLVAVVWVGLGAVFGTAVVGVGVSSAGQQVRGWGWLSGRASGWRCFRLG